MRNPEVGTARIVKSDGHNVCVQVYTQTRNPKTKELNPPQWVDNGYFGHRIDHAAGWALFESMREKDAITRAVVEDAIKRIVDATKAALEASK